MLRFAVIFSLILCASVQAAVFEPAPNTLTLLGKGIRDRDTGASLALACVGPLNGEMQSCSRLRWVLWVQPGEQYFVEQELAISGSQKKALKRYLKDISKSARTGAARPLRGILIMGGAMVALIGAAATFGTTAPVMAGGAIWMTSMLTGVTAWIGAPGLAVSGNPTTSAQDQSHWNWADTPRNSNHRYFVEVLEQVAHLPNLSASNDPVVQQLLTEQDKKLKRTERN